VGKLSETKKVWLLVVLALGVLVLLCTTVFQVSIKVDMPPLVQSTGPSKTQ
jgi:hypothetical protein